MRITKKILKDDLIESAYMSGKDRAKLIRDFLKKKYGFNSKDVGVRVEHNSALQITLKTIRTLSKIGEISDVVSKYESIYRDEQGEIMTGGNFFVFINVDSKIEDELGGKAQKVINKYQKEIENQEINTGLGIKELMNIDVFKMSEDFYNISYKNLIRTSYETSFDTLGISLVRRLFAIIKDNKKDNKEKTALTILNKIIKL